MPVTIGSEELDRVARFTAAMPPDLSVCDGVWLLGEGPNRKWSARRNDLAWVIEGDDAEQRLTVCLPADLIWFAAELARIDESCTLDVARDGLATVESTSGHGVFDLSTDVDWRELPAWPTAEAQATVRSDRLLHAVSACSRSGLNADLPLMLASRPGSVMASAGGNEPLRATYSVPAMTVGTATAGISHRPLTALLGALAPADGDEVRVEMPGEPMDPIGFRGPAWKALIATHDLSCRRWTLDLEAALDDLGLVVTNTGAGVYRLTVGRRLLRAALHSGPPEIVRFSTVLARRIPASDELWDHLNSANRSLAGVRVWHDSTDEIVAAVDLPCGHFEKISAALEAFTTQLEGFDVFLAAVAG